MYVFDKNEDSSPRKYFAPRNVETLLHNARAGIITCFMFVIVYWVSFWFINKKGQQRVQLKVHVLRCGFQ